MTTPEAIDKINKTVAWYRDLPRAYANGALLQDASRSLSTACFIVESELGDMKASYTSSRYLRKTRFAEIKHKFAKAGSVAKAEVEAEADETYQGHAKDEADYEAMVAKLNAVVSSTKEVLSSIRQHISSLKDERFNS